MPRRHPCLRWALVKTWKGPECSRLCRFCVERPGLWAQLGSVAPPRARSTGAPRRLLARHQKRLMTVRQDGDAGRSLRRRREGAGAPVANAGNLGRPRRNGPKCFPVRSRAWQMRMWLSQGQGLQGPQGLLCGWGHRRERGKGRALIRTQHRGTRGWLRRCAWHPRGVSNAGSRLSLSGGQVAPFFSLLCPGKRPCLSLGQGEARRVLAPGLPVGRGGAAPGTCAESPSGYFSHEEFSRNSGEQSAPRGVTLGSHGEPLGGTGYRN